MPLPSLKPHAKPLALTLTSSSISPGITTYPVQLPSAKNSKNSTFSGSNRPCQAKTSAAMPKCRATSHYPSASARNITTPINSALFWKHMPPTFSCPTSPEQASRAASASPTSPKPSTSHSPLPSARAMSCQPPRNSSSRQAFSTLSSWNTSTRASS